MFAWFGRHIILSVGIVFAVIAFFILRRGGSSSSGSGSGVVYDGGVDPQTATAEVQAQAGLAATQYAYGAQAQQTAASVKANEDTIGGQIALAQIQAGALNAQNTLAAQVASEQIDASLNLGKDTNSTNVSLAQVAANQAVNLANTNAGVINNQTNALVAMANAQQTTNRAQIKANSGPCFITTIVCETLGKSDDCYELQKLREFRDGWMMTRHPELCKRYKQIAPAIVDRIKISSSRLELCEELYSRFIVSAVRRIEHGEHEKALLIYRAMVVRCEVI